VRYFVPEVIIVARQWGDQQRPRRRPAEISRRQVTRSLRYHSKPDYQWRNIPNQRHILGSRAMLLLTHNTGNPDRLTGHDATLQTFPPDDDSFSLPGPGLIAALGTWLRARTDPTLPAIVMVHGFLYDPRVEPTPGSGNALGSVYAVPSEQASHHLSWLPIVGECSNEGAVQRDCAIAFTYQSSSRPAEFTGAGWGNSYQYAVFDQAPRAARALATLLAGLGDLTNDVRVLAHSLGTRVTTQAVRLLRARTPQALTRIVLLDGAEFCVDAAVTYAGCPFDVINIVNRTDLVLRLGAEQACHPVRPNGSLSACVIGYEGLGNNPRWLDLQLDRPAVQEWFASGLAPDGLRYVVNPNAEEESHAFAGLDHWSCYTNDGNRGLVGDLLLNRMMTVENLRRLGVPDGTDSPSYGRFDGVAIPPTPATRSDRQRLLAQAMLEQRGGAG
jgi:hypothetical protein